MKVFIDTNVFLDAFLNRDDGSAKKVLKFVLQQDMKLFCNDITIVNIVYLIRKKFSKDEIDKIIDKLIDSYTIVPANSKIIADANHSLFKDFEDGIQYFCVKEIEADLIITNNKKDFTFSKIEVLSPVEFRLLYLN